MPAKTIGIIAHEEKTGAGKLVDHLASGLSARGLGVAVESSAAKLAGCEASGDVAALSETCDLLLVVGGDGTMLRVVHRMTQRSTPVLGINHGALGFLTCTGSTDLDSAMEAIASNRLQISERTLLEASVKDNGRVLDRRTGLNDVVLSRGEISRLVHIGVEIDGTTLTHYHADGLIIATPTGSTAYSLSAGGPILMPDSAVFVVTPICPHVLTNRSVIVNDASVIHLRPDRGERPLVLAVDGQQIIHVDPAWTVEIRRSTDRFRLALLEDMTFAGVLRRKLRWTGSNI